MNSDESTQLVGIPVFPGVDLLDVTGPMEVLAGNGVRVVTIAHTAEPSQVATSPFLRLVTDLGRGKVPRLNVLLVPGGPGLDRMLVDDGYKAWLAACGRQADWVASICAGSLLLAAAGLLDGYRATTHWASLDLLRCFPKVTVDPEPPYPRYVVDRNRMTSGGVTSCLDMALVLRGLLLGSQHGKNRELLLQYDPEPPYEVGTPELADETTLAAVRADLADMIEKRRRILCP